MSDSSAAKPSLLASVAVVVAAGLLLNVPLSVYVWAPVGRPLLMLVPLVESLLFLWLVVIIVVAVRRPAARRWLTVGAGALFGIFLGFAAAEAFFRFYYARAFSPRGDIGMIRGALLLFLGDIGPAVDVLTPVTTVVIFLLVMGVGAAIMSGARALLQLVYRPGRSLALVSVVSLIGMLVAGLPNSLSALTVGSLFPTESRGFVEIDVSEPPTPVNRPVPEYEFPGLKDRDIYLFAIEAYGYASVIRPRLAAEIDPHREKFEQALRAQGYSVVSSFLQSPVAGGYSWLAETTLLTGQWIDSQERFLELYGAGLPSLSGVLNAGGYYTYTVRPGTIHGEWPEGWDLFRFDELLIAHGDGFEYNGPWFSYVPVTDQFALWRGNTRVEQLTGPGGPAHDRPLLAYYQLVSSHTPFNRIPPIIRPWSDLGDGSVYNERADEIETFRNTWTGGSELEEGYVAAISYVFEVLTDYVSSVMNPEREPIIIVFGDHQPQRPIRSANAELSVPIHVASRDKDILALFEQSGFQPGMKSNQPPPHLRMDKFFPLFTDLASTPAAAAALLNRE